MGICSPSMLPAFRSPQSHAKVGNRVQVEIPSPAGSFPMRPGPGFPPGSRASHTPCSPPCAEPGTPGPEPTPRTPSSLFSSFSTLFLENPSSHASRGPHGSRLVFLFSVTNGYGFYFCCLFWKNEKQKPSRLRSPLSPGSTPVRKAENLSPFKNSAFSSVRDSLRAEPVFQSGQQPAAPLE